MYTVHYKGNFTIIVAVEDVSLVVQYLNNGSEEVLYTGRWCELQS